MPGFVQRWLAACSATESATTQALFRIAIGLCTLLSLGTVVRAGLVDILWVDKAYGGMREISHAPWLIEALGGPTPSIVHALLVLGGLGAVALTIGLGGRPVALLTAIIVTNLVDSNSHAGGSYDELMANALWLAVLSGGHKTLSVDARLRTGTWWPQVQIIAFPRWLAIWQLCLMYGTTGLQKVSTYWVPGGESSALYYIMQQPTWQRGDMRWVARFFPLTQVATTITWLWEVTSFFWIAFVYWAVTRERPGRLRAWSNRLQLRWVYAVIGFGMHVVIFATMEVGPFSPLSLAFYLLLADPTEWERWLRRQPSATAVSPVTSG